MAYSELIKNFERIRNYMKEFYVYGFKTRDEYKMKSGRSYDNEKRRIEGYLGEYMGFRQSSSGKNVFISIDSRSAYKNPLYQALKAKSFTDGDITIHFILFDILYSPEISLSISEITKTIDIEYLSTFKMPMVFDESTIRKKLKEYCELGLIKSRKSGKQVYYHRTEDIDLSKWDDAIEFFSESNSCGVIGNFLLDKKILENANKHFSFKHHYITHALESEVICELFDAIYNKSTVKFNYEISKIKDEAEVIPLKIYVSVQNGRQYLFGYSTLYKSIKSFRLDYINKVKIEKKAENYEQLQLLFEEMRPYIWGVSLGKRNKTEHVEFTLHINDDEEYIFKRLDREKRCGTVTRMDKNTCHFMADVYDTSEMIPWIRTFIGRIIKLKFSNRTIENQFKKDIKAMYSLYDIGGEE